MRVFVEQIADGMEISKGQQPAIVEDDDLLGDSLYLFQNVARYEDRLSLSPKIANHTHDAGSSDGVATVQRFVEDYQVGVVDEGDGQLVPLAHAHGKSRHLPIPFFGEADEVKDIVGPHEGRFGRNPADFSHVGETGNGRHPLAPALPCGHVAASPQAVEPSYMEALATSMPVSIATCV